MVAGVFVGILCGGTWLVMLSWYGTIAVTGSTIVSLISTMLFCLFVLLSLGVVDENASTAGASTAQEGATKGTDVYIYGTLVMGLLGMVGTGTCAYYFCYLQQHEEELGFIIREV